MREYYIRREGDEDASGPFDIDQISSLIEADKLDPSAYFYDIETESWLTISSNAELMDTLYPKKRKLTLRTEESIAESKRVAEEEAAQLEEEEAQQAEDKAAEGDEFTDSEENSEQPLVEAPTKKEAAPDPKKNKELPPEQREKLEVTKMLALAEGRSQDSSGKSPREKQAAVAFFALRFLTLFFAVSIAAMAYIEKDLILAANAIAMAKSPYLILAAFDLIVVVTLLLQVTEIYPLLRFRAAIGAGLLSMLFYSSGDTILLVSNLLLMLAIYFCSAIIKIRFLVIFATTGFLGILGYIYAFFLS